MSYNYCGGHRKGLKPLTPRLISHENYWSKCSHVGTLRAGDEAGNTTVLSDLLYMLSLTSNYFLIALVSTKIKSRQ